MHKKDTDQTAPTKTPRGIEYHSVAITVPVPTASTRLYQWIRRLPRRTQIIGASVGLLLFAGSISYAFLESRGVRKPGDTVVLASSGDGPIRYDTGYDTVLPAGKTIETLGGWTRVSPPNRNPVFAYADTIGNTPISVSQQPLPDDLKGDTPRKVEELAQWFKADQRLTIGDTKVYIGTSAKGPQSVIFVKDDLLILIKSSVALSNDQWTAYITSLN